MSTKNKSIQDLLLAKILHERGISNKEFKVQNRKQALAVLIDPATDHELLNVIDNYYSQKLIDEEIEQQLLNP